MAAVLSFPLFFSLSASSEIWMLARNNVYNTEKISLMTMSISFAIG